MSPDEDLRVENEKLRASSKILQCKLQALQEKYDILHKAKLMAEDKYKRDYRRWINMQGYMHGKGKRSSRSARRPDTQIAAMGLPLPPTVHGPTSSSPPPPKQIAPTSDETYGASYLHRLVLS